MAALHLYSWKGNLDKRPSKDEVAERRFHCVDHYGSMTDRMNRKGQKEQREMMMRLLPSNQSTD